MPGITPYYCAGKRTTIVLCHLEKEIAIKRHLCQLLYVQMRMVAEYCHHNSLSITVYCIGVADACLVITVNVACQILAND